ncbi:MAG: (Fe-S)-binding protein [Candidatus Eisenbacteria bacterium]|nr:(Fe-S)-binding protein [Candidatus Eisenbacteria bacterium]
MIAWVAGDAQGTAAAHRELMWNMGTASHYLMYGLMLVSFALFAWGARRRIREWKAGAPDGERFGQWGKRIAIAFRETFLQRQTRRRFLPGLFHSLVFYSFIVLFITTLIVMADMDFGIHIFHGPFYLGVSLAADLAGGLLLAGLAIAAVRRYFARPDFLPASKPADGVILLILAGLALTGLLAEGARMRFHPDGDPWRAYTPLGRAAAWLWSGIDDPAAGRAAHFATWWVHAFGTFAMIALIPHTKFFHMLGIPANQLFSKLEPAGSLRRVDIEAIMTADDAPEDFTIGIADARALSWKQRLDLDACVDCGRCDSVCPARLAGASLSPRRLIADLRDMHASARQGAHKGDGGNGSDGPAPLPIIGAAGTVFENGDFVWLCRTCHACQSLCPAAIEHVDLFVEMRRSEVMMEGRLPKEAAQALKTMEAQGNPFGAQADRMDFVERLGLEVIPPGGETEILLWIGCAVTFDPEKQKIAEDLVAILKHAGAKVGHLGRDETCCGDPARVLGDENLFQTAAKQTVAALQARRFATLLVLCPHGVNVFRNEYPQFGGRFPVRHHSELLAEWIATGRLKLDHPVHERIVFHDPCYLGRYQGIVREPRRALAAIPGARLAEMTAHGRESDCCGAGGGHYWMDLEEGTSRVNNRRCDQAAAAGAQTIAVACPFCDQMLIDGLKARDLDEKIRVADIATLVRQGLGI